MRTSHCRTPKIISIDSSFDSRLRDPKIAGRHESEIQAVDLFVKYITNK